MKRNLTLGSGIFQRFILPFIWLAACWIGTIIFAVLSLLERRVRPGLWPFLFFSLIATASVIWEIIHYKDVSIDEHNLYISDARHNIRVPLSEMKEAHYKHLSQTIEITLKSQTPVGTKILFRPKKSWNPIKPPMVDELIEIINSFDNK